MKRLAITIAVMIVALYTPAFSDNSEATQFNNGAKLMFEESTDKLFRTYHDLVGMTCDYSDDGEFWLPDLMVNGRFDPAIAEDSTGERWVAVRQPEVHVSELKTVQEVYYLDGAMWRAETLYWGYASDITLGPPSIAGASSTTTSIVYVAFLEMDKHSSSKRVILTKFNGTTAVSREVATSSYLGDPAVTVEPYKADSDHLYVTWENGGDIKYCMDTDGRSSSIADKWTAVASVSDEQATSHHPSINADRDRVVFAWAQGSPPEVYARQLLSGQWEDAANQSGTTYDSSDYPTIALGDAVVVAWEESESSTDHDIKGHVDFEHDITIYESDTISSYPHVVLQTDGEYLYLHTIWSDPDYDVGYCRLDLNEERGEGRQSASSGPILAEPSLAACLPNPFHSRTQISYALPTASNVSLQVYDAAGRPVRTLADGFRNAGSYSVSWDARDTEGKQVPYGIYFYRLDTPGFRSVKKAVVTK